MSVSADQQRNLSHALIVIDKRANAAGCKSGLRQLRALMRSDLDRYRDNGCISWHEPSLWAVLIYRFSRWTRQNRGTVLGLLAKPVDVIAYPAISLLTGIQIGRGAAIGPGLRIWHFGGVIINTHVKIGSHCTIRHNVTIGNRRGDFDVPVIGDDVDIGVGATVIGAIQIGDRAVIGAGAVVLTDVPADHLAVGNPARIVKRKSAAASETAPE
jgi:serine O-acetyltransferase